MTILYPSTDEFTSIISQRVEKFKVTNPLEYQQLIIEGWELHGNYFVDSNLNEIKFGFYDAYSIAIACHINDRGWWYLPVTMDYKTITFTAQYFSEPMQNLNRFEISILNKLKSMLKIKSIRNSGLLIDLTWENEQCQLEN